MIVYKPGDTVLVAFPFTDFSTFKQRPAIIISSEKFNRSQSDVIIMAITSHAYEKNKWDHFLSKEEQKSAGLPKSSIVKVGKITTIDQRLIRKRIGHLPKVSIQQIASMLQRITEI